MRLSICFFLLLSFLLPHQGYPMDTPDTGQHFQWHRLPTATAQESGPTTTPDLRLQLGYTEQSTYPLSVALHEPRAMGFYPQTPWTTAQPGLELVYGYGVSPAPQIFPLSSSGAPLVYGQQWFYHTPSEHPYAQQWLLGSNQSPLWVPPLTHFPDVPSTLPPFQGAPLLYGQQYLVGSDLPTAQSMQTVASTEGTNSETVELQNSELRDKKELHPNDSTTPIERRPCRCGSKTHQRITHHRCPLNPERAKWVSKAL